MIGLDDAIGQGLKLINGAVERIWSTPEQRASAEATVITASAHAALESIRQQMSILLAEAQSPDKWTSRARPTFLYVMYLMILICIPFGVLWAFDPAIAERMAEGMRKWLSAIPEGLWATFGLGYAGYSLSRSWEKGKGMAR